MRSSDEGRCLTFWTMVLAISTFLVFAVSLSFGCVQFYFLTRADNFAGRAADDARESRENQAFFHLHVYLAQPLFGDARFKVRTGMWGASDTNTANLVSSSYDQAGILIRSGTIAPRLRDIFLNSSWGESVCDQWEELEPYLKSRVSPSSKIGAQYFSGFGYLYVLASQIHRRGLSMKIVSGGQTGADQAALDVAILFHLSYGGWVPKGGLAENFPYAPGLLNRYPEMVEAETSDPAERTKLNVLDSDVTIILVQSIDQTKLPGTKLTIETANRLGRPYLIQVVDEPHAAVQLSQWLSDRSREKVIRTLNIAGPRSSEAPELYDQARALLETALPFFLVPPMRRGE